MGRVADGLSTTVPDSRRGSGPNLLVCVRRVALDQSELHRIIVFHKSFPDSTESVWCVDVYRPGRSGQGQITVLIILSCTARHLLLRLMRPVCRPASHGALLYSKILLRHTLKAMQCLMCETLHMQVIPSIGMTTFISERCNEVRTRVLKTRPPLAWPTSTLDHDVAPIVCGASKG